MGVRESEVDQDDDVPVAWLPLVFHAADHSGALERGEVSVRSPTISACSNFSREGVALVASAWAARR